MCGINGIYGLLNSSVAREKIIAMNDTMKHRGPDDEGVFVESAIALGHRRLSIIDLSAAGHQPMSSPDKRYHIVYNGELYNYKALKFELQRVVAGTTDQAYFFQTNTDTEVILASYMRWGKECVHHFNGMFAFAIWDSISQQLFVSRDRLGIKPLYYLYTEGVFAFSSEIRSLIASGLIPVTIDEKGVVDYLRYQTVYAPGTIIKGIKMLLPGHSIIVKEKDVKIFRYWQLTQQPSFDHEKITYKEVCKNINLLLTKSVERRLVADVPFGAFLSGGIDSSTIVGLMHKTSTERVRTFSVTFDEAAFSESKYASLVAKKYNTDHNEIRLKPADFLKELPEALAAMDHPSGDGPNTYVVSKATKYAGITMALSGLGGDELFGGYPVFKRWAELANNHFVKNTPRFARIAGGALIKKMKPGISSEKISELLKQKKINFEAFYTLTRQVLLDKQIKEIFEPDAFAENNVHAILKENQLPLENHLISTVSIAEITTYMQNVLLRDTDQMSMANALEVRVPFLDHTLVEYVLSLPDQFKKLIPSKKLLIDSMGDLLPMEISKRSKMGFTLPWEHWMKNELKNFCEQRLEKLGKRKGFKAQNILKLWQLFLKNDKRVSWSRIWILVVLENWLETNGIDG